jgi:hypothetical protein
MTALHDPGVRGLAATPPRQPWGGVGPRPEADDAGLRHSLRLLGARPTLPSRLVLLVAGCAPLAALGLAVGGALPLRWGVGLLVVPAAGAAVLVGLREPIWARRALLGLAAGVVATAVYDVWRLGLVAAGMWTDPIPLIGALLLADDSGAAGPGTPEAGAGSWWVAGYLWRYLADGGGLGVAYLALPWRGPRSGMLFGGLVAAGVLVLLALAPQAQGFLPLEPVAAAATLAGHLIYGAVLGMLAARWLAAHPRTARLGSGRPAARWADRWPAEHPPRQLAPHGRSAAEPAPNGGVIAVVWAGGLVCATLGVLAVAGAASETIATALTWTESSGRLGGTSTLATVVFLVAIPNLLLRYAGRHIDSALGLRVTLALVAVGLAGTFPPVQHAVYLLFGGG